MHVKTISLLIICFCIATGGFGQPAITNFFADVIVQNAPPAYVLYNVPFKAKAITITDNRPDTIEIGLFRTMENEDGALRLYEGENIPAILKHMLVADTGAAELRLVLNHFFITTQPLVRSVNYEGRGGYNFPCMLTINAKLYIKQQNYWQGLLKIDTSYTINTPVEKSFTPLLNMLAEHLSKSTQLAIVTKSYLRRPHLTDRNIDSLNMPATPQMLDPRDSSGFFMTFADFMNGNFTPANIKLVQGRPGIVSIYKIEKDNTEVLVRDAWGAVKGETTYIFRNNTFSTLVKVNNAWFWKEVYGYRPKGASQLPGYATAIVTGRVVPPAPWDGDSNANFMFKAYMLNMQTGDGH